MRRCFHWGSLGHGAGARLRRARLFVPEPLSEQFLVFSRRAVVFRCRLLVIRGSIMARLIVAF